MGGAGGVTTVQSRSVCSAAFTPRVLFPYSSVRAYKRGISVQLFLCAALVLCSITRHVFSRPGRMPLFAEEVVPSSAPQLENISSLHEPIGTAYCGRTLCLLSICCETTQKRSGWNHSG